MADDDLKFTPGLRQRLFGAITGRSGDVSGAGDATLTDRLVAAFGPGPRGGAVDVRAAAKGLGVTPRTIQRWVAGQVRSPKPQHIKDLARLARQAATTKAGRRAALAGVRGDRASRYGATMSIRGNQGPDLKDYARWRTVRLDLTPDQVQAMRAAYEAGGDKGAMDWFAKTMDQDYVADWKIFEVSDLRIDPR